MLRNYSLLLLFLVRAVLGQGDTVTLSGGSPLPTTFQTSAPSRIALPCVNRGHVKIFNGTSSVLAFGWTTSASAVPTEVYDFVPAGPNGGNGWRIPPSDATYLFLASPAGSTTSGNYSWSCVND